MSIDNNNSAFSPSILICDPQYMTRSSFSLLAKEIWHGEVIETTEIKTAKIKCEGHIFDLIILGLDEQSEAISLIRLIRDNLLLPSKDVPIIVMFDEITLEILNELKSLNVSEILVKPTRMKTIYDSFSRYL
jgi:DNA-binding NtrC family response regulator